MKPSTKLFVATALISVLGAAQAQNTGGKGGEIFRAACIACHNAAGQGIPGLAPALAGPLKPLLDAGGEAGLSYVRGVLLNGLSGKIVSQGQPFTGAMPPQNTLTDEELAAVANFVAQNLNGIASPPFTADSFGKQRATPVSHKDLRDIRASLMR